MDLEHVLTVKTTPEDVLRAQLGTGERLLWMGRPRAGLRLGDYGQLALLLLSLALIASLLWILLFEPTRSGERSLLLFVIAFSTACTSLARPVVEVLRRSRTVYAVTDRRVLVSRGRRWKIGSYLLRNLTVPTLSEEHPDGSGTVQLNTWLLFERIEQAREVSETIHRAQRAVRFPLSYPRPVEETT